MHGRTYPALLLLWVALSSAAISGENLIPDPSFEEPKDRDRWGLVFAKWGGWKYEGDCEFHVGKVARTGKYSCLLYGVSEPKIRIYMTHKTLERGRYRTTAYIRGLDIGTGKWNQTTEFAFNGKYIQLKKNGTFGWTELTYVGEVTEEGKEVNGPSFGLMAPGYFWIDDVTMEKVADDVPLTDAPVLGQEEAPIAMPGELGEGVVRCPECGYRNMPAWKTCYACGTALEEERKAFTGPAVKILTSFEDKSPFGNGQIVEEHATDGTKAWKWEKNWTDWSGDQDWTGYDYLKADLHTDAEGPMDLYVEIRDKLTTGYWTRVNYNTVIPPGSSTLVVPIAQLYVGEKSRPGRNLLINSITRLVFSIGENPSAPLCIDNIRLERDVETPKMLFEGLYAFDLGSASSALMPGFRRLDRGVLYSKGRGYGLRNPNVWRVYDVLQPDPLYQDFICLQQGGIAVDVPDGSYHVFINMDNPSGYWGEYQKYRERVVLAEGAEVVKDTMDFDVLKKKYYRFWDVEDAPSDDTFDKYQEAYYEEKEFDVDVDDGQLNVEFKGSDWACSVSAIVVYPNDKAEQGRRFLDYVKQQRRFFFDNYFKRVLHVPSGGPPAPTAEDQARGYVLFTRDYMQDVYYNDTPKKDEVGRPVEGSAFCGEFEPLTFSVCPLKDLGRVTVEAGDLTGPTGTILCMSCVAVGFVSNRVSRVTMEGSVYTIKPRLIMPSNTVDMPASVTRRFWLNVRVPENAHAGVYKGKVTVKAEKGEPTEVPVSFRVYAGLLDQVDVPAGPWGYTIDIPWYGDDPATQAWNHEMARKSLGKLRENGFTSFSGMPRVNYNGFKDGRPQFDFSAADAQMKLARETGFNMPVVNYCHFGGLNLYYRDAAAMQNAGFTDYSEFIKAVFDAIQEHADAEKWLPVYWNLGDEPIGDDLTRAAENAEAYRKAFPKGPPFFTAATSFSSADPNDGHFRFGKAVHVGDFNTHNEPSIKLIHEAGSDWAFYNGGNRWTYGIYMYKAAKQFDMKFRLSWHWNVVAGDPYYALDCREDDYAWCNSSPDGTLIPSLHFEREMREGLDDYRHMLTLARLAKEKGDKEAEDIVTERLAAFKLGQRNHDAVFPSSDWREFRCKMAEAIERLRR